ncbi:fungal hydrophobin-domain-containing protein [Boletus edulis BED1]|uniref:Hydrophobin n=1 Tax=Boletus edulis BED1 TaxID=1328754 RepID=A0AAD4B8X7_BOLED|nr:fungal hydrophobin-domain-containing protein [Boletus edulis BED1]KAF8439302.1 fungal hydrophobin-domain-containing protein [Boletus edulis BED1]
MFARFVTLLPLAALAAVAAAAPNVLEARTGAATCSSGSEYCCNQKFAVRHNPSNFKGGPLGLIDVLLGLGVNAGVQCSPITIIGALSNGAQCTQQTACCENVQQNGLVNVACSPVAVPV